jgi:putative endonuclease
MTLRREATKGQPREWFTYILECADGTFYVGITTDLQRRLAMHNRGVASRFTCGRRPVRFRYAERRTTQSDALRREIALKGWSRRQKQALFRIPGNILTRAG